MGVEVLRLDASAYEGVIFDMDGVITRTAALHAQAWKQMFDSVLGKRGDPSDPAGVETFPGSVLLAGQVRLAGLPSAVVTASKNGRLIMERSGLMSLFDVLVDGNVASALSLRGKPEPDIMLEAARRLGVRPDEAILFEDALAGVQAGRAAGMKLVVGVARDGNERPLKEGGADVVVDDLSSVRLLTPRPCSTAELAPACEALEVIETVITHVPRTLVFLDYDGTLTPIVERPELAKLDQAMRHTLSRLAERHTVAVISGRELNEVRSLVGLDGVIYAGSHGFEIAGPEGNDSLLERGEEYFSLIDEAEQLLRDRLSGLEGVLIERKRLSVAVHFRLAPPEAESVVSESVDEVMSRLRGLRRSAGKKVIELQPGIDWNKGKAVDWLLAWLGADPGVSLVIYIGDDLTDEDAFRALRGRGVGIVVRDPEPRDTYADLYLEDPDEVRVFLEALVAIDRQHRDRAGTEGGGSSS